MLGRPGCWNPVWMNVIAGSWLIASVCIDLMTQMSSTIFAVCGSSSLTHVPDLAVLRELEHATARPGSASARRHAGEPLALRTESGRSACRGTSRAPACSRTGSSCDGPPDWCR